MAQVDKTQECRQNDATKHYQANGDDVTVAWQSDQESEKFKAHIFILSFCPNIIFKMSYSTIYCIQDI